MPLLFKILMILRNILLHSPFVQFVETKLTVHLKRFHHTVTEELVKKMHCCKVFNIELYLTILLLIIPKL